MCINLDNSWHSGKTGILLGDASVQLKWTGIEVCLVLHCSVLKGCQSLKVLVSLSIKVGKKRRLFMHTTYCGIFLGKYSSGFIDLFS